MAIEVLRYHLCNHGEKVDAFLGQHHLLICLNLKSTFAACHATTAAGLISFDSLCPETHLNLEARVDVDTLKKVVWTSVATALASMVLPVPGGPNSNTPCTPQDNCLLSTAARWLGGYNCHAGQSSVSCTTTQLPTWHAHTTQHKTLPCKGAKGL